MLTDTCGQPFVPKSFAVTIGDVTIETVPVPPGLTAAEAQHRMATWQGLRDAVDEMHRTMTSPSRELYTVTRKDLAPWLPMLRAALAAADGETP